MNKNNNVLEALVHWIKSLFRTEPEYVVANITDADLSKSSFKSPEEALEYLAEQGKASQKFKKETPQIKTVSSAQKKHQVNSIPITQNNLPKIKVGMIWYEDDTCSTEIISGKKIKSVIELIKDNAIYGDLSVSDVYRVKELKTRWEDARDYIYSLWELVSQNESIVWYSSEQSKDVYKGYDAVIRTLIRLKKPYRKDLYWTSNDLGSDAEYFSFSTNEQSRAGKRYYELYVRPVLRKVLD